MNCLITILLLLPPSYSTRKTDPNTNVNSSTLLELRVSYENGPSTGSQKSRLKGCVGIKSSSFEWASLLSSKLLGMQLGTRLTYNILLKLDPRNAIPVLELGPNLVVSEIFSPLTTSGMGCLFSVTLSTSTFDDKHKSDLVKTKSDKLTPQE